ncbi:Ku protein [Catenulispora subtropica]|uniref:Non-homologous end joining protein Ku n=1 Tax=Catenulispora subtropica TaxID=450798 RepID=A0ABN2TAY2_9ACTN
MARPVWTGVLTFGLVALPVGLYTAVEDHSVRFHQLERGTSDRVRNRRVNERTGDDVDYDDIVKGYEVAPGEYVVVDPDELEEMSPTRSKTIEVDGFVDLADVEPIFFDRTYYLGPAEEAYAKIYKLITEALEHSGRAGIASFTMRGRTRVTAVLPQDGTLVLQTMHYADEIRDPRAEVKDLPTGHTTVSAQEREMAEQLIATMALDWNPEDYHDSYNEQVMHLVKEKAAGHEIVVAQQPQAEATNVVDLLDALKRSVADARAGRSKPKPATPRHGKAHKQSATAEGERGKLADLTKAELYERATELGVRGRSKMDRDELREAVESEMAA